MLAVNTFELDGFARKQLFKQYIQAVSPGIDINIVQRKTVICVQRNMLNLIFFFEGTPKQLEDKMVQKLQEDVPMEEDS